LFVANGHIYPQVDRFDLGTRYHQRNQLFENLGAGPFREITAGAGAGLAQPRSNRGASVGDYDNDGDLDILVGVMDDRPLLLRNDDGQRGRWLGVSLIGTKSNRDAVGALVTLVSDGQRQVRLRSSTGSFLSSHDPRLHFGLGAATNVDQLEVRWPSGATEKFERLPTNRLITIEEGTGRFKSAALR
ncbi:MAG TPA: CRTAC1 family protein, partial [Acidobacteriota bacterium]